MKSKVLRIIESVCMCLAAISLGAAFLYGSNQDVSGQTLFVCYALIFLVSALITFRLYAFDDNETGNAIDGLFEIEVIDADCNEIEIDDIRSSDNKMVIQLAAGSKKES